MNQKLKLKPTKQLQKFIIYLFTRRTSAFIIIKGRRGSGKTDFALLIAEVLHKNGVIKNIGTNIKIYESPFPIEYITNLEDLEHWAITVRGRKLFIFDEAGKTLRRRTPLSKINIEILDKIQIMRKYQLSLIFITPHEGYIDSAIFGTDVLDGVFTKTDKNVSIAIYEDRLYGFHRDLFHIPPTSIKFDTWDSAPMKKRSDKIKFKDRDLQLLWEWAHGKGYKELGLHPMQLNRLLRKFVRGVLENKVHASHLKDSEVVNGRHYSQNSS